MYRWVWKEIIWYVKFKILNLFYFRQSYIGTIHDNLEGTFIEINFLNLHSQSNERCCKKEYFPYTTHIVYSEYPTRWKEGHTHRMNDRGVSGNNCFYPNIPISEGLPQPGHRSEPENNAGSRPPICCSSQDITVMIGFGMSSQP